VSADMHSNPSGLCLASRVNKKIEKALTEVGPD
jgi:hypothetical protein